MRLNIKSKATIIPDKFTMQVNLLQVYY